MKTRLIAFIFGLAACLPVRLPGVSGVALASGNFSSKKNSPEQEIAKVRGLLRGDYDFNVVKPAYLWRSQDGLENLSLIETVRPKSVPRSLDSTKAHAFRIFDQRKGLLETQGLRSISLEDLKVESFQKNGTRIDIKYRYIAPSGRRMQAHERIYSSASRVRSVSHTTAIGDRRTANARRLLDQLEPKWADRKPAAEPDDRGKMEAGACLECLYPSESSSNLRPLPLPSPSPQRWSTNPACKEVEKADLKTDFDQDTGWMASFYNEGMTGTGIGCAQGVIELGTDIIWTAWQSLKGSYNFVTDSEYREEILTALGTAASETWNDPAGVASAVWNAVTAILIKEWEALPCLNDRAGARTLCKAVASLISGGYAPQIIKFGLKGAMAGSAEIRKILSASLKPSSDQIKSASAPEAKVPKDTTSNAEKSSTKESSSGSPSETSSVSPKSSIATSLRELTPRQLPFKDSLATKIERAKKLGELDDSIFTTRLRELNNPKTRDQAFDELRRLDLLLTEVLRADGATMRDKVDGFLSKYVSNEAERRNLRSCLLGQSAK